MDKHYHDAFWVRRPETASYYLFPAGNYPAHLDLDWSEATAIDFRDARKLMERMKEDGMMPKEINEEVREDDLEITHRHLDIIEKMVEHGE